MIYFFIYIGFVKYLTLTDAINSLLLLARMFVTISLFQPSLIFVGRAKSGAK
jgi:hypothetical protein